MADGIHYHGWVSEADGVAWPPPRPSAPSVDIAIEKVRELVQKIRRQGCLCLPKLELLPSHDDNTVSLIAIHEDGCPARIEDGA